MDIIDVLAEAVHTGWTFLIWLKKNFTGKSVILRPLKCHDKIDKIVKMK
jgi:hypothetical protein